MPFYTRQGDKGMTGLLGGCRVKKSDLIFEVLGTIDETSAALGVSRSQCKVKANCEIIYRIQKDLWLLMGDVASVCEAPERQLNGITEDHVKWLEEKIAVLEDSFTMPDGFTVPGDSYPAALLDVSRATARRAERHMAAYIHENGFHNLFVMQYLNRLSSLCYALELRELDLSKE